MAALATLIVSACQVGGTPLVDAAGLAAAQASAAQSSSAARSSATRSSSGSSTSTSAVLTTRSSATGLVSPGTIEDRSTGVDPTVVEGPTSSSTEPSGPTVVMADDGFAVSVLVTTIWSRALVAKGAKVGIRTIGTTAAQVAALRGGGVDLVQQYNSGLLEFLDGNSEAVGAPAIDAAITRKLPAGLSVLRSTPANDGVQLVVSAATATRYGLHSISDLAAHLAEVTLLLPNDGSGKAFAAGLSNYYGLTFATTRTTDFGGVQTIAATRSSASVGLMDASQYQIDDNKFVLLTDPEHLFLTQNFIPVVGGKRVTAAMRTTVDAVSAKLTVAAVRGLRKKIATGQGDVTDIADRWLSSVGLR